METYTENEITLAGTCYSFDAWNILSLITNNSKCSGVKIHLFPKSDRLNGLIRCKITNRILTTNRIITTTVTYEENQRVHTTFVTQNYRELYLKHGKIQVKRSVYYIGIQSNNALLSVYECLCQSIRLRVCLWTVCVYLCARVCLCACMHTCLNTCISLSVSTYGQQILPLYLPLWSPTWTGIEIVPVSCFHSYEIH